MDNNNNPSLFVEARNRFYKAKYSLMEVTNEYNAAKEEFQNALKALNETVENDIKLLQSLSTVKEIKVIEITPFVPELESPVVTPPAEKVKRTNNSYQILRASKAISNGVEKKSDFMNREEKAIWLNKIKPIIKEKGKEWAAGLTGIHVATINNWIRYNANPSKSNFKILHKQVLGQSFII